MDWSKGYSSTYYLARVDPKTWRDVARIEITGGSISRTSDGLLQSADIDCTGFGIGREDYVRVYLDTAQNGAHAHVPLFTGLATSPDRKYHGRMKSNTLACYSVLKPADDIVLPRGYYAPAGMPGGTIIGQLLTATPAPVEVDDDSPELQSAIIAEDGETNLTMIEKILTAINWRLRIDGDGTIRVIPKASTPVTVFDPTKADVIETEITITNDWYECPNVVMCLTDDLTAIARDDSTKSALSTVNRGREVWKVETDCDLGTNESIAAYAARRLLEMQKVEIAAEYDRRFIPAVMPGDLVRIHYPEQDVNGVFEVGDQNIELGHAARTSEKVFSYVTMDKYDDSADVGLLNVITDDTDYLIDKAGNKFVMLTDY